MANLPQIIDAMTMIGVVVRPDHRIDAVDPGRQQLFAHIGCRVDQDARLRGFNEQRNARAAIARLGGVARSPVIADTRNP
jgi:hypothetical protein